MLSEDNQELYFLGKMDTLKREASAKESLSIMQELESAAGALS
jgi:hypothetical protein